MPSDAGQRPEALLEAFDDLKRRFATATDFGAFWDYFVDAWASRPGFMDMGAPAYVEDMESLIQQVANQMTGSDPARVANTRLIKIPEAGLVHGSCLVDGNLSVVIYFEDLEMGLFVLLRNSGKTSYARFTLRGKTKRRSS
ncbi:hypothetical protein F183_A16200 [Bryobacterales bacterium F-183]|nr:hypothetical protein F183_A16200 [Bryobacterales bacterium F-183]